MSVLEEIDAKVSQLPPELQAEMLDFIKFLAFKESGKTSAGKHISRLSNKRGSGKKVIAYVADDFNAPLDDLKDYV
jgi:hypothetical protein